MSAGARTDPVMNGNAILPWNSVVGVAETPAQPMVSGAVPASIAANEPVSVEPRATLSTLPSMYVKIVGVASTPS